MLLNQCLLVEKGIKTCHNSLISIIQAIIYIGKKCGIKANTIYKNIDTGLPLPSFAIAKIIRILKNMNSAEHVKHLIITFLSRAKNQL